MTALLEVQGLVKEFRVRGRRGAVVHAVSGVSFAVAEGETLGLVGESGSGKTTTARLVTRLLDPTSGSIRYRGEEIARASRRALLPLRRELQIVFQDPFTSLNPRHAVGTIVGEPLQIHGVEPDARRRRVRVQGLLERVGLQPDDVDRYPHELSGGQRQRVGIARAIALGPRLLVADEPVSALDVSIQAQILALLEELRRDLGLTLVLVAHDLAVVRHACDRVAVMHLGEIVETAATDDLFARPRHPYTAALLQAVPSLDPAASPGPGALLPGDPPSPIHPPSGCRFRTRCPRAQERCAAEPPPLAPRAGGDGLAACHFPLDYSSVAGSSSSS